MNSKNDPKSATRAILENDLVAGAVPFLTYFGAMIVLIFGATGFPPA